MSLKRVVIIFALLVLVQPEKGLSETSAPAATMQEELRSLIEGQKELALQGRTIRISQRLLDFYRSRDFRPLWIAGGKPSPHGETLVGLIKGAYLDGLRPQEYQPDKIRVLIEDLMNREGEASELAELEILITNAFLRLGLHSRYGRINLETYSPLEYAEDDEWNVLAELPQALARGTLKETVQSFQPGHPGYGALRLQFIRYLAIADAGGWVRVPGGSSMKKGDSGKRVVLLKKRLAASDDLAKEPDGFTDRFDDALVEALKRFQKRHGLTPDGTVGPATLRAINVSLDVRIRQMELNLERWRWLWRHLGRRYIMVNVPDFSLTAVEQWRPVITMRAVVGKHSWDTPVFSAKATYLVLNPSWHVPRAILAEEILPALREDPGYLERHQMVVLSGRGNQARQIDPAGINWQEVDHETFSYRIVQKPGPENPLGRIKFMLPNKYEVYLHDTSSRDLFEREMLAFSHGCIRIEKPFELAQLLLGESWNKEMLRGKTSKGTDVVVPLPKVIDVHIVYLTSWVDEEGVLQFRDDIYGRDTILDTILPRGLTAPNKK